MTFGFFRRRHAYEVSIQSMQWKLSPDDLDKGTAVVPLEVAGNQVRQRCILNNVR